MKNQEIITKFIDEYSVINRLGKKRVDKYKDYLGKFDAWLSKPFSKVTREDLLQLVRKIDNGVYKREDGKPFSPDTIRDIKVILKTFGKKQGWDTSWIKTGIKTGKQKIPEELLTQEEIVRMIQAGKTARDKALMSSLYESGARFGEWIAVRLMHLQFNGNFVRMFLPESKTMKRPIPLVSSLPYLKEWINNHPFADNPKAYLWCSNTYILKFINFI